MSNQLGYDDFLGLAAQQPIVPVWREVVADTVTPVGAFLKLVGDRPGFLLESVESSERWGRYSFIGRNPLCTVKSSGKHVTIEGDISFPATMNKALDSGILATIDSILSYFTSPVASTLPPLHSGLVGYLGYDVVREIEHLENVPYDDLKLPDALFWVIGELCAFDHWRQRAVLLVNVFVGEADQAGDSAYLREVYDSALSCLDVMEVDLASSLTPDPFVIDDSVTELPGFTRTIGSEQYCLGVEAAREYIFAGDIFQVVPSQRFDVNLRDIGVDPFDVYRVLRLINPSPYLYFLRTRECTIAGASPEPLVRLRDGVVVSRPIAGTRKRGSSEKEDEQLEAELVEHPKEVAEHIMLVDLARNDVGKVVEFGSEKVDELMTVERYSHVMHLTSQVSGRLRVGKTPVDVIRATFPAGTLSGAPKVRAMQIIDELEVTKRGVYGGLVGYMDFSGSLDTAIAIRTMVVTPDGVAHIQAGAGVVADSDPEMEDRECFQKASSLLQAISVACTAPRRATNGASHSSTHNPASSSPE